MLLPRGFHDYSRKYKVAVGPYCSPEDAARMASYGGKDNVAIDSDGRTYGSNGRLDGGQINLDEIVDFSNG